MFVSPLVRITFVVGIFMAASLSVLAQENAPEAAEPTSEDSVVTTEGPTDPPASTASESQAATGNQSNKTGKSTGAQTMQDGASSAPLLQGSENGTIAPQGANATVIPGINTSGTVRVQNLANLEALTNIIANGMIILGIAWGGPTIIMGFMSMSAGQQDALKRIIWGLCGVTGGMATPGVINWLVASGRDAGLFN